VVGMASNRGGGSSGVEPITHPPLSSSLSQVYASLQLHALPDAARALLQGTGTLGQRETKRTRLKRELAAARAGVAPGDGALLTRRRRSVSDEDMASSSESSEGEGEGDGPGAGAGAAVAAGPPSPSPPRSPPPPPPAAPLSPASLRAAAVAARAELGLPAPGAVAEAAAPPTAAPPPSTTPARARHFARPPALAASRAALPIIGMEQEIMEAVRAADVVLLGGETGCGKTTQVPQFLLEAGHGSPTTHPETGGAIAVTQPRRVAAAAAAARVAAELGAPLGGALVGYRVRHDRMARADTALVFMTDGVLLRELESDFLLSHYSAVVVDEAHERSLATDLLLGLLSRIVRLRRTWAGEGREGVRPLKLVVMSATLRAADFRDNRSLFATPPPTLDVPARQYPVTVHFARRTERGDYARAAVAKAAHIHRALPPGGVLIFLTGKREVEWAVARLRRLLAPKERREAEKREGGGDVDQADLSGGDEAEADAGADSDASSRSSASRDDFDDGPPSDDDAATTTLGGAGYSPAQVAAAAAAFEARTGMRLHKAGGEAAPPAADAGAGNDPPADDDASPPPALVLPLYAALPPAAQARVFDPPPPGHRLIVVATNVAETSLTLPGVRYVVDAGRAKVRSVSSSGSRGAVVARYEVGWASKASAEQRAGRAGRTGPGHAYRLYSSAVFEAELPPHAPPAVDGCPLDGVVLTLRALGVDRPASFPFPSAPPAAAVAAADAALAALGALDASSNPPSLTPLGVAMAALPLAPRHARALVEVASSVRAGRAPPGALPAALAVAAAVSVESPFEAGPGSGGGGEGGEEGDAPAAAADAAKKAARAAARAATASLRDDTSDALTAAAALASFEALPTDARASWAASSGLSARRLAEAAALRRQLAGVVARLATGDGRGSDLFAGLPSAAASAEALAAAPARTPPPATRLALRRALAAGWADQIARRVRSGDAPRAPGAPRRAVRYAVADAAADCGEGVSVHLHPSSALARRAPDWIVYTDLVATAKRAYACGATEVDPRWLARVAAPLVSLAAVPPTDPGAYDPASDTVRAMAAATFGPRAWPLPAVPVPHPDGGRRAAAFAAALLAGRALPTLQVLQPSLLAAASTAADPAAAGVRRVGDLLHALSSRGVDSVASLAAVWANEPTFLADELAAWLAPGERGGLAAALAAARAEAAAKAGEAP